MRDGHMSTETCGVGGRRSPLPQFGQQCGGVRAGRLACGTRTMEGLMVTAQAAGRAV